jgi:hypothetical protein
LLAELLALLLSWVDFSVSRVRCRLVFDLGNDLD